MLNNKQILYDDELVIWSKKAHYVLFLPAIFLILVSLILIPINEQLSVITLGLSVLFCITSTLQVFSTYIILTNKNIRGCIGTLRRYPFKIPLEKVDNITIYLSSLGSLLHYGTLHISAQNDIYVIKYINHAKSFKDEILNELKKLRN